MEKTSNLVRKGNKKLPQSTYIFNSGTARHCPSKKLGLCQCAEKCYARKAEIQYPDVYAFRMRQATYWKTISPKHFVVDLLKMSANSVKHKMTAFRFNESGDFSGQRQLNWFAAVCRELQKSGISCYGYTARTDLNLEKILKFAAVNVSNDNGDWQENGANRFKAVPMATGGNPVCQGSCKKCTLCQKVRGITIEVVLH